MLDSTRWLVAVGVLALSALPAFAFQHQEYRADDGTAYQVLRSVGSLGGGADLERITTVAGAESGTGGCNMATNQAAAVIGVIPPNQTLHPFASIRRTAILVPNDAGTVAFDPTGAGEVVIGTGGGATRVCRNAADCSGGAPLVGLATADANVPAACIASGVQATCEGNARQTIGFGLPASGNPPQCQSTPTVNTSICGTIPTDGFSLSPGQAIVFVYNGSLAAVGFGVGAGAFGIDADDSGSVCMDGGVVSASAPSQSLPGPGAPAPDRESAPAASPALLAALGGLLGLLGARRLRRG
jgi:hypothetical protein